MNCKSQNDETCKRKQALFIERFFPLLMTALKYSRMCSSESFSKIKIMFLTGLVAILFVSMFVNVMSEVAMFIVGVDTDQFADVVSILPTFMVGLLKWSYCSTNNKKLFDIVKKLEKCHILCQRVDSGIMGGNELYKKETEHVRWRCNIFFLWWSSFCNFAVTQWITAPLLLGTYKIYLINDTFTDRNLPYTAWFPLDINNIYTYIFLYMVQTIGMFSSSFGIYCCDSFYVTMLIILSAQLRYVNKTLTKSYLTENKRSSEAVCILKRKLRNCVDFHVEIIEFLAAFQKFVSPIMFVQCVETVVVVCFLSFQALAVKFTMDKDNMLILFNLMGYFFAISVQLWFFCFFAGQITHLILQIPHSVYSCGWEIRIFEQNEQSSTDKQFKHSNINVLVQMVIMQAQKPIILTGGPFYTLSMETFRAVLSMALSNSIMLRQLSNPDE